MRNCANTRYENEFLNLQVSKGWHCERVAGSGLGQHAVCDLVLFREGKVYLVEIKATKEPKFYFRAHIKKQLDRMVEVAKKSNVGAILAVKYKYRGWEEQELLP
ncbi:MAG: hypothetical protein K9N07_11495 [Candidatus Cloacimonetes bacterium]|nr:hypothetical protein [Candidatus Cloacimonadota bacterium]